MTNNIQKTPFGLGMNRFARGVAKTVANISAWSLPATVKSRNGALATVNYEVQSPGSTIPNPTVAMLGSRYWRPAIQPGEKGFTIPADAGLAQMNGLGTDVATLTNGGNLSTSVWVPIGNMDWPATDPNQSVATGGSSGLLLRDSEAANADIVINSGGITLSVGGSPMIEVNSGAVIIQGHTFLLHVHTDVATGTSNTGTVV